MVMLGNAVTRPVDDAGFLGVSDILGWVTLLLWAVLCAVGWLTASLASTHKSPVAPPSQVCCDDYASTDIASRPLWDILG